MVVPGLAELVQQQRVTLPRIPVIHRDELEEDAFEQRQREVAFGIDNDGAVHLACDIAGVDHACGGRQLLPHRFGGDRASAAQPGHDRS